MCENEEQRVINSSRKKQLLNLEGWRVSYVIIGIICAIGCLWQISSILNMYFMYPTTVSVSIEESQFDSLPAVTVCIPLCPNLHQSKLRKTLLWKNQIAEINAL